MERVVIPSLNTLLKLICTLLIQTCYSKNKIIESKTPVKETKIKSLAHFIQTKNAGFILLIILNSVKESNRALRLP